MIVLDEQLMDPLIEEAIIRWYKGPVRVVCDLRPGTVIKDDAIVPLLRQLALPTFVTINVKDFWQKVEIDDRFCVMCFNISAAGVGSVPELLKLLLRHDMFRTKRLRCGHVIRMNHEGKADFYRYDNRQIQTVNW